LFVECMSRVQNDDKADWRVHRYRAECSVIVIKRRRPRKGAATTAPS